MSNPDQFLGDRRRALEESFFTQKNIQLLERLRQELASNEEKKALAASSGISDPRVLDALLAANIRGETVAALALVPLVFVAWSDGKIDAKERQAILSGSETEGITKGSVSYELLDAWLSERPGDILFSAWTDFIRAAKNQMTSEALRSLQSDVLGRAERVATASGGLLGLGSISPAERATLQRLNDAFRT